MRQLLTWLTFFLCIGFLTPAWAQLQAGLAWLTTQSQPDGSYVTPTAIATPVQSTVEVLRTFQALEVSLPAAAQAYLTAELFHNTEYLARKIIIQTAAGERATELVSVLLTHQNVDGGFGDLSGYHSTVLDTALALEALAAAGVSNTAAVGAAVGFLLRQQLATGGWEDDSNPPSISISALTMRALWLYRQTFVVTAALDRAQAFLLAQRAGATWSESFVTAMALLAIIPRLNDLAVLADSLSALRAAQAADGSWGHDVYTTALVLRVLALAETPVPNPDLGTLLGRVIDGDSGFVLSDVTVELAGTATSTHVTSADGAFQFTGLPAGTYSLTLRLTDYGTLVTTTLLPTGGRVDFGDLHLLKFLTTATTGAIRGVVTDATTQAPIAGATITAHGQTAHTASDGSYQLSAVPPGPVTVTASRDGYVSATASTRLLLSVVLVFSPRLAPSPGPTTEAAVFGTITDAVTGLPLEGVTVSITGSTTATALTASDGTYRIAPLATGPITLEVLRMGYDTVRAFATVSEQEQLQFSPALYATATTPPGENTSGITGVVLNATTNAPLAGVTVTFTYRGSTVTLHTADDGRFTSVGLIATDVELRFTQDGFHPSSFRFPLAPLSVTDIGQVRLRPKDVVTLLPDLVVMAITVDNTATDPQTLAVSGMIQVTIRNQGLSTAPSGFTLLAFSDVGDNGVYDPDHDTQLGSTVVPDLLASDGDTTITIAVQGTLPFRDAPISVWVDSALTAVESDESNNVASSQCQGEPAAVGTFTPVLEWQWTGSATLPSHKQVMMMPAVVDMTADGLPEIIFTTFTGGNYFTDGHLRVISGQDGQELFTITDPSYNLSAGSNLAVGDIDHDSRPEIIAVDESRSRLIAFEHDGTFKWRSPLLPHDIKWGGPALADLDQDGTPEIVLGAMVLNANGTLRWVGTHGRGDHRGYDGPLSLVANLDLVGTPEVVAGGTAYRADGSIYWQQAVAVGDGFTAVGNFDADVWPEVVLVAFGRVYLLEHNGTMIWGPVALPGGGFGGPPTVADVDADGAPEIGVAGGRAYTVFETDGSIKWSKLTQDISSQITGSSVFDFEGDGRAEIVYGDEVKLRIYRGTDGTVLWETPSSSGTLYELPVIADVDADGQAEIIKASNNYNMPGINGIQVYGDADRTWMPTRQLWNQHTYHITNVNDDGTIPAVETPSWLTHNTYRLNTFIDRHVLDRADLTAAALAVVDHGTGQPLSLRVRVGNGGVITPTLPVTVAFYQGDPAAGGVRLGTVTLSRLVRGGYQDVQLDGVTLASPDDLSAVIDPDDAVIECDESNNMVTLALANVALLGQIAVATDAPAYGPNSPVTLTATVTNSGSLAAAYEVQFRIVDSADALVATLAPLPVASLAGGASLALSQTWNTGTLLTGDYFLVGTLSDHAGTVLDEATVAFAITAGATVHAALRLTADRPRYNTSDTVHLATLVRNLTTNTLFSGTVVQVHVLAPSGQTVLTTTVPAGDLGPGAQREGATTYRFQAQPEGSYSVTAQLRDVENQLLASAQTTFAVLEDLELALVGSVVVEIPVLERGAAQRCTDTITNHGTRVLGAQPLRQLLVSIASQQVMARTDTAVDLAPGTSQTLRRTLDTSGLAAGDYACVLQTQIAGIWQTLDAAVFTVQELRPIQILSTLTTGDRGRVLVLLDSPTTSCHKDGWHDDNDDETDDDHDDCGNDPHGPGNAPTLAEQHAFLEALLSQAGWSSTITTNAGHFTRAFRSGGYAIYLLIAEHVKLAEQVQYELREAVYRGEGLIVAGGHDHRNGRLDEPLGIRVYGKTSHARRMVLFNTPLHPAADTVLALRDRVARAKSTGATVAGHFVSTSHHHSREALAVAMHVERQHDSYRHPDHHHRATLAVTMHDYGLGRTVFTAFDLLAEATLAGTDSLFANLLLHALDIVQPAAIPTGSGAGVPVQVTLANQGIATPGQVVLTLPAATAVLDTAASIGIATLQTDDTWLWTFTLAEAVTEALTLWVRLPFDPGPLTIEALVQTGQGAAAQDYETLFLELEVTPTLSLAEVRAQLRPFVDKNKTYRRVDYILRWAEYELAHHRPDKALKALLIAAMELRYHPTTRAAQFRLAVAAIIRDVARLLVEE
jgi:hypothetical protein